MKRVPDNKGGAKQNYVYKSIKIFNHSNKIVSSDYTSSFERAVVNPLTVNEVEVDIIDDLSFLWILTRKR